MKTLYLTLFVAVAMPCMADISIGSESRPASPKGQAPIAQPDLNAEKAALWEAIKLMTDEKGAAAAQKQLAGQQAAMQDMAKKYDEAVKQIDALGSQVEAQLQKEVSRVADMAEGKALTSERDKKMHAILMQQIPESGYDASGAHDFGGSQAPEKSAVSRTAPPLRPLPQMPTEPVYDTSGVHDIDASSAPKKSDARQAPPLRPLPAELQ
jgi:hypothetical protein